MSAYSNQWKNTSTKGSTRATKKAVRCDNEENRLCHYYGRMLRNANNCTKPKSDGSFYIMGTPVEVKYPTVVK